MYKVSYTGDGVRTEFSFVFPFFQTDDVHVAVADKVVTAGVDYSVIPNEQFDGGVVVFSVPPDDTVRIDICRQISLTRIIDYQPTAQILPEHLNEDFNFLLEAFRDLRGIDIDLSQWAVIHSNILDSQAQIRQMIQDKLSPGAWGIYNNLLSVLADARPYLINDYGYITEAASNENRDDYGVL